MTWDGVRLTQQPDNDDPAPRGVRNRLNIDGAHTQPVNRFIGVR